MWMVSGENGVVARGITQARQPRAERIYAGRLLLLSKRSGEIIKGRYARRGDTREFWYNILFSQVGYIGSSSSFTPKIPATAHLAAERLGPRYEQTKMV